MIGTVRVINVCRPVSMGAIPAYWIRWIGDKYVAVAPYEPWAEINYIYYFSMLNDRY